MTHAGPGDPSRLADDTSPEIEERLTESWRQLSTAEVAERIRSAWHAGRRMAMIGLRERYPDADENELRLRLAVVWLGRELAEQVHPEVRQLAD